MSTFGTCADFATHVANCDAVRRRALRALTGDFPDQVDFAKCECYNEHTVDLETDCTTGADSIKVGAYLGNDCILPVAVGWTNTVSSSEPDRALVNTPCLQECARATSTPEDNYTNAETCDTTECEWDELIAIEALKAAGKPSCFDVSDCPSSVNADGVPMCDVLAECRYVQQSYYATATEVNASNGWVGGSCSSADKAIIQKRREDCACPDGYSKNAFNSFCEPIERNLALVKVAVTLTASGSYSDLNAFASGSVEADRLKGSLDFLCRVADPSRDPSLCMRYGVGADGNPNADPIQFPYTDYATSEFVDGSNDVTASFFIGIEADDLTTYTGRDLRSAFSDALGDLSPAVVTQMQAGLSAGIDATYGQPSTEVTMVKYSSPAPTAFPTMAPTHVPDYTSSPVIMFAAAASIAVLAFFYFFTGQHKPVAHKHVAHKAAHAAPTKAAVHKTGAKALAPKAAGAAPKAAAAPAPVAVVEERA